MIEKDKVMKNLKYNLNDYKNISINLNNIKIEEELKKKEYTNQM